MPDQISLPQCAIPGCTTIVTEWGLPCTTCIRDFGPMLAHNPAGRRMTEAEIADRDQAVAHAYAAQRAVSA